MNCNCLCRLSYKDSFSNYTKYFLDDADAKSIDKFDFVANKNAKYLFYRFYDLLLYSNQHTIPIRHFESEFEKEVEKLR